MEIQNIPNNRNNLDKEEITVPVPDFSDNTTKLQSSQKQNIEPRNKSVHCGQLIYNKDGKNIYWRKTAPSISCAGKSGQLHVEE